MIIANKYDVIGELGRGGMGIVYKVRHLELGVVFALKTLHVDSIEDAELLVRFQQEARVMAELCHPNIPRVSDIFREEGRCYVVMEYVQGRDLSRVLREQGPLPLDQTLRISIQVGETLTYAHSRESAVIHRDIKPSNILIEDGTGRAMVTDFGIAKLLGQEHTRYTRTGMYLGTPRYSAPEQLRAETGLDGRVDIYALGLVIYEMLSGRPFFEGLSEQAIIGKLLYDPHDNVPVFEHAVPEDLRRIVAKAIAKDRDRRYQAVAELLVDLTKLYSADQTVIIPPGRRRPRRRLPVIVGVVGIPMMATLALTAWYLLVHPIQNQPPQLTRWIPQGSKLVLAEGETQDFRVEGEDPDGEQNLTYRWLLDGKEVATGSHWRYELGFDAAGVHGLQVEARASEGDVAMHPWTVTVADVNRPPRLTAVRPQNQQVAAGTDSVTLRIEAYDPDTETDEDRLTYTWTLDGKPLAGDTNSLTLSDLPGGSFQVAVIARDRAGAAIERTWSIEVPRTTPTPTLRVVPDVETVTLNACEGQTFAVEDGSPDERFIWWVDGGRREEEGARLVFSEDQPGKHEIRVTVAGEDTTASHTWEVVIAPVSPSEEEVYGWLEEYRRALEQKDIQKLGKLGYADSDQEVRDLSAMLEARQRYQVSVQDIRTEAQGGEVRLSFERVGRWYDERSYSMVVDYTSQKATLVRQGCGRVVAKSSNF